MERRDEKVYQKRAMPEACFEMFLENFTGGVKTMTRKSILPRGPANQIRIVRSGLVYAAWSGSGGAGILPDDCVLATS